MATHIVSAPAVKQHPLRNPSFRLLWAGNTISWTGDQFYLVALPWLILQLTGSSIVLGTITMMAAIPRAALMLLGGAVTDRISPRRIMMLTASARTVLVAAVSVLLWMHVLHLWQLYILALCFGVADAFAGPSAQAYLPSLVEPEQLAAANSVSQSTVQVATLVAPGPVGLFIKAFGTAWAFFIDAMSFLFIIGALWRLPDPPPAPAGTPRRKIAVVTGRPANEIAPLLGLDSPIEVWGLHGAERLYPDGRRELQQLPDHVHERLKALHAQLRNDSLGGLFEAKPNAALVHWRGISGEKARRIEKRTLALFEPLAQHEDFTLLRFESGIELRAGRDKSDAIRTILAESAHAGPAAFLGDDITDEAAFQALKGRGLSVLVRKDWRETAAEVWLRPPAELKAFLRRWFETAR